MGECIGLRSNDLQSGLGQLLLVCDHERRKGGLVDFHSEHRPVGECLDSCGLEIRSHAQKYFLKVQKNGTSAHVPPPRPKRKAAHPYPQKAPKNNSSPVLWNPTMISVTPACGNITIPPADLLHVTEDDMREAGSSALNNCICNNQSSLRCHAGCEVAQHGNCGISLQVVPDFARIYSFIGSLFDPSTSGHLQKLKEMKPVDVETVVMMMSNLSINLLSPEFEVHKSLLSFYDAETQEAAPLPVVAAV